MSISPEPRYFAWLLLLLSVALTSACSDEPATAGKKNRKLPPHLVEVISAQPREVQVSYERTGSLKYRKLARIYNQIEGQITRFPWFEGDQVLQNDVLTKLDDRLLKAEQAKTSANVRQAKQDLERVRKLKLKKVASEDEVMRARTALDVAEAEQQILATRIGYTEIRAPFDAVIIQRLAEPGDVKPRNSHLLTLAAPLSIIVEVSVSELLLPQLAKKDPVIVRIDAIGRTEYQGRISRIHPQLDSESRQGLVEIQFDQPPGNLQAGQFARVKFATSKIEKLMIPFTALHRDRRGEYVYILVDGKAHHTPVRSGMRIKQEVEVLEGLVRGQQIIIRGFLGLSDNKKVKIANQGKNE
jgi:RND family efflux transporter MFP subunit